MQKYFSTFVVLFLFLLCSSFVVSPVQAAGSMYFSPSQKTLQAGDILSLDVRVNSGVDVINAVQVTFTYPVDKLEFLSIQANDSAFPITIQATGGNGTIAISRGILGAGTNGDKSLAKISFKAKQGTNGTAALAATGKVALVRSNDQVNIFTGTVTGTYTIGAATIPVTLSPIPPTPSATGVQNASAVVISDIKVANVSFKEATITWKTSLPASSFVEYGLTNKFGSTAQDTTLKTEHKLVLPSETLAAGTSYHYRVKSADAAQREAVSTNKVFVTKGVPVTLVITDEAGVGIADAKVTLATPQNTYTKTSDAAGVANFENIPATKITVLTDILGETQTTTIVVKEPVDGGMQNIKIQPQNFMVQVAGAQKSATQSRTLQVTIVAIVVIIVVGGGFLIWWIRRRRMREENTIPPVTQPAVPPIQPSQPQSPAQQTPPVTQ